ncbi:MAG TPA: type II CRISPR RNA-guided endonuclease Cas9 [Kiritimatiellae bacterium]|nr:type II CRISPR RNA-guided endonuclease Cas9 [Kiritimatiellia bacterium]
MSTTRVLGLDIGTSSVGWALIEGRDPDHVRIIAAGVRVFPMGVDEATLESRNIQRRQARLRRRQIERRARRKTKARHILQSHGFLPPGDPSHADPAWASVLALDPYKVRAEGLHRRLQPYEFGRAIYHICQRRGFKSNRKRPLTKKEKGAVHEDIAGLKREMDAAHAETLGEYLNRLDPRQQRRRGRHTNREWYREEFRQLCERQRDFGLPLSPALQKELEETIFSQRKVWWKRGSIGRCSLEPGKQRAARALPVCQRFRMLQRVNDLQIILPDGTTRQLSDEEREKLLARLDWEENLSFKSIRKLLRLPAEARFNLEEGGETKLPGNSTAYRISRAIGKREWERCSPESKAQILEALMSIEDEDLFKRVALRKQWGLNEEQAERLSEVALEEGRLDLSTKAIRKLLPLMEKQRLSYAEAAWRVYGDRGPAQAYESVPPVEDLRNPTVQRSLAETRRIVNAVIRRYGKPDRIHIELARDLKAPKQIRLRRSRQMRRNEAERKSARKELIEQGLPEPTGRDIEKYRLWKECGKRCPYTGKMISFSDLFGPHPKFDIEHIIPWHRCLLDSFANKTLCEVQENRSRKGNRTPYEAYSGDPDRYEEIKQRVREFTGPFGKAKLRRFRCEDIQKLPESLPLYGGEQLNATAYAARYAARHLALLYPQEERRKRVQVSAGRTTAYLRRAWNLNRLIGLADEKNRADYRHHAVDAVVIALTTPKLTGELSKAAARSVRPGTFQGLTPPPGLTRQLEEILDQMVVSHRVDRRVNGQLHEETFYGRIDNDSVTVVRKPLADLTDRDVAHIVDKKVQRLVREKLSGGAPPSKVFANPANLPAFVSPSGRTMRIRHVRVRVDASPVRIGSGAKTRLVLTGGNHHLEVFRVVEDGREKWRGRIVTRLEAMQRKKNGLPIVSRTDEDGHPLLFSLAIGDTVRLQWKGKDTIAVVQKLSANYYVFREHTDGRRAKDRPYAEQIVICADTTLQRSACRKLCVDPLGNCTVAHD